MSDHDNPFSASPSAPATPEDLLAAIKNEQGEQKYKTVDDALKALASSQAFIPQLLSEKKQQEEEINKLREAASRIDSIEEVMKKLTAQTEQPRQEQTSQPSGLSADAVAELVRKELEASSAKASAAKNFETVQSTLKQKFGEKVKDVVAAKAIELGTSPEQLGELAAKSPAMVLALFNAPKTSASPTSTGSHHLPEIPKPTTVAAPAKSVLLGATAREQKDHFLQHKAAIYEKFGVTS